MITYRRGDIFKSEAESLVNPVNCVGVSGKGLAQEFKKRFPQDHRLYRDACIQGLVSPGSVFSTKIPGRSRIVIHFPTKEHWKHPSKLEWIKYGMISLAEMVNHEMIGSIAIPKLGCGNGGLLWKDVKPIIEEAEKRILHGDVNMEVWI